METQRVVIPTNEILKAAEQLRAMPAERTLPSGYAFDKYEMLEQEPKRRPYGEKGQAIRAFESANPGMAPAPSMDRPSMVSHPPHYNSGRIEVIEFIEDQGLGFSRGNAVKYIARAGKKAKEGTLAFSKQKECEDLEKAAWYIQREIELLKAEIEGRAIVRPNDMVKR